MSRWPRDNQAALIAFYGTPGSAALEAQLINVVPPFRMTYEGKPIKAIRFHKKAAGALLAALTEIWEHYGKDQSKIDALGISKYAGAYNPRFIRGSSSKWSNHAYGAAIDLNAEDNGFGAGKGTIPKPVIDAFKRQGARWGGDYKGRTDPMHFEFCDNGEPDQPPLPKAGSTSAPAQPVTTALPVLRKGDKGDAVKKLQAVLGITVDSDFGPLTEKEVKKKQTGAGIASDGVVGRQTWAALGVTA